MRLYAGERFAPIARRSSAIIVEESAPRNYPGVMFYEGNPGPGATAGDAYTLSFSLISLSLFLLYRLSRCRPDVASLNPNHYSYTARL